MHRRHWHLVAGGALLAALAAGCGSDPARTCEPGLQVACACPGGGEGSQACREDGSGWEACQCCQPDCAGRNCGSDGCGGSCGTCDSPEVCGLEGRCAPADGCCMEQRVRVSGQTLEAVAWAPAAVGVAVVEPLILYLDQDPVPLAVAQSSAGGLFDTGCIDATLVDIGLMVRTDDLYFDGYDGDYFPTVTLVQSWATADEKRCVEGASAFALTTEWVMGLDPPASYDPTGNGFVLGFILDAQGVPVEGARLYHIDGWHLGGGPGALACYLSSFMNSCSELSTSSTGAFLLPSYFDPMTVTPVKEGMAWNPHGYRLVPVRGHGQVVLMRAE